MCVIFVSVCVSSQPYKSALLIQTQYASIHCTEPLQAHHTTNKSKRSSYEINQTPFRVKIYTYSMSEPQNKIMKTSDCRVIQRKKAALKSQNCTDLPIEHFAMQRLKFLGSKKTFKGDILCKTHFFSALVCVFDVLNKGRVRKCVSSQALLLCCWILMCHCIASLELN